MRHSRHSCSYACSRLASRSPAARTGSLVRFSPGGAPLGSAAPRPWPRTNRERRSDQAVPHDAIPRRSGARASAGRRPDVRFRVSQGRARRLRRWRLVQPKPGADARTIFGSLVQLPHRRVSIILTGLPWGRCCKSWSGEAILDTQDAAGRRRSHSRWQAPINEEHRVTRHREPWRGREPVRRRETWRALAAFEPANVWTRELGVGVRLSL